MQNISQYLPITDPTWIFFIVLCIILFAPILMGKLRIPHIIGMVLAGVIVGPHGFNILSYDSSFELFGKVGLYYIMFLAGLEMNMADFRKNRIRTSTHGLLAFAIPMIIGFAVNTSLLKYGILTSVLLASMYASHTLIAYPIVLRYGISKQRSVTIAVGATAITDTLTLLVLAIVGGMFKGEVNGMFWIMMVIKLCIVFFII
ncbi:MAG: cation:proton antiporter, partial [Prevotella sp.]